MPLAAPWDKLLPEMRLRVREIVRAIRDDTAMPMPPTDYHNYKLVLCPVCEKLVFPRGLHSHMRQHRNHDSWIRP